MAKQESMSAAEYRKMMGLDKIKENPIVSAREWQEKMKKQSKKPLEKNKQEIAFMLKLARIEFEEEFRFHVERKWRFDFAILDKMIAIEYEGIYSEKSRHTHVTGFVKDAEKYNEAAKLGWKVLRYTAGTYKNVINDIWNLTMK